VIRVPRGRRADAGATLVSVAVVVTAAAVAWSGHPLVWLTRTPAIAFGFLIVGGELLRLRLGVCRVSPVGFTGAMAYLITAPPVGAGHGHDHGLAPTVALIGCATLIGTLPHLLSGRPAGLDGCAARIVAVAVCVPARYVLGVTANVAPRAGSAHGLLLPHVIGVAAFTVLVAGVVAVLATVLAAVAAASHTTDPVFVVIRNQVRDESVVLVATGLTAALTAVAADALGSWAVVPVVAVPLLFFHLGLRRFARMRATYDQTVSALARLTEAAGYTQPGHAERTGRFAVAIGASMGLPSERLRRLRFAALLHDVGQLSLTDPVAGGATSTLPLAEQRTIADLGARVITKTARLSEVAQIVLRVPEPYRVPHLSDDPVIPLESRIVKVANTVDELLGEVPAETGVRSAVERLRFAMAYEYDPRVVAVAERLLRAGVLERSAPL
jgi:hypothetical protein